METRNKNNFEHVTNLFSTKANQDPLGEQLVVEFYGCDNTVLDDVHAIETIMIEAARAAKATIVGYKFHKFSPQGVSGAVIVAESHLAIHTWPEYNYCSVDIFTCGKNTDNNAALHVIKRGTGADRYEVIAVNTRNHFAQDHQNKIISKENDAHYIVQDGSRMIFIEDYAAFGGMRSAITIKSRLAVQQSPLQKIEVFDTVPFGKMLTIDGIIMLTQFDNFAYHEMIAHVPLNAHPNPQRVLIVGGGDGGTLKEVLKHNSVQEVVLCEIDEMVIDISQQYFPELASSFSDERVCIKIADGAEYIKMQENYFDVIIVDSTDFFGPAESLYRKEFYQGMHRALTQEGIAVTQSESMYYDTDIITKLYKQNKTIFPFASYYFTQVPTYPSGTIGFSYCSNKYSPSDNVNSERIKQLGNLQYYNEAIHHASFALPQFMKNEFGQ